MVSTLCQIPLRKLYVRASENREPDLKGTGIVTKLAESIDKLGVINPLDVQLPNSASKGEWYRVIDGGMRLAALKLLLLQGKIKKNKEIPCMVRKVRLTDKEIFDFRNHMSGASDSDCESRRRESFRSGVSLLAEEYNLMPHQAKLVAELMKAGRLHLESNKQIGKTAALNFAVQAEGVGIGNLFQAYQAENRTHRIRQPWIVPAYNPDFTGVEMKLAEYASRDVEYTQNLYNQFCINHGYGMTPEFYHMDMPTQSFDLGDRW